MRAADTNVLVRLLVRDDTKQVAAVEQLLAGGPLWISHLVFAETTWVLDAVYGVKRRELALAVEQLLDHASLSLEQPDVIVDALTRFTGNASVGFSDCMVVAIAKKAGHQPLMTFDRALSRLEGTTRV